MRLRSYPANTKILTAGEVASAAAVTGPALHMATDVRVGCGMKYQMKLELVQFEVGLTCDLVLTSGSSSASEPPSCSSTASSYPDPPSELVPGEPGEPRKQ